MACHPEQPPPLERHDPPKRSRPPRFRHVPSIQRRFLQPIKLGTRTRRRRIPRRPLRYPPHIPITQHNNTRRRTKHPPRQNHRTDLITRQRIKQVVHHSHEISSPQLHLTERSVTDPLIYAIQQTLESNTSTNVYNRESTSLRSQCRAD